MNAVRYSRYVVHSLVVIGLLLALGWLGFPGSSQTLAQETNPMASQPVTNKGLIRNGGFDYGMSGWYVTGINSGIDSTGGQDGGPVLSMEAISGNGNLVSLQELYLPSQTTSATFTFDYRLLPTGGGWACFEAGVMEGDSLATATVVSVVLTCTWTSVGTGWQSVSAPLSSAEVSQIQAAHAAGKHVWIVFNLWQTFGSPNQFKAHVDNVSFKVSGSRDYPTTAGAIAYARGDQLRRVNPDTSNDQAIFSGGTLHSVSDVAWQPDASDIAFVSNHESAYSRWPGDIYAVNNVGGSLRRVTNPPARSALPGGYAIGQVTGQVFNNSGEHKNLKIYVQGALEPVDLTVLDGDTDGFTINNVADLGATATQYVVVREGLFGWPPGVTTVYVTAGGTVDAGTITVDAEENDYSPHSITWKGDGSQVGFESMQSGLYKVPEAGGYESPLMGGSFGLGGYPA